MADQLSPLVTIDPEIMGGKPVFRGTRVPTQSLVDHLVSGITLDEFLDDFPTVSREQAIAFIEESGRLFSQLNAAPAA